MTLPYTYTDPDKNSLTATAGRHGGYITLDAHDPTDGHRVSVTVLHKDLPGFVAALYVAEGRPTPVILDPPDEAYHRRANTGFGVFEVAGRHVAFHDGRDQFKVDPDMARKIAAVIATMADIAEAEPDPAEVERLAAFFGEEMDTDPESLARLFLSRFEAPAERAS